MGLQKHISSTPEFALVPSRCLCAVKHPFGSARIDKASPEYQNNDQSDMANVFLSGGKIALIVEK